MTRAIGGLALALIGKGRLNNKHCKVPFWGLSSAEVLAKHKLVGDSSPPMMIEFKGKSQPASVWAKSIGVSTRTLKKRIKAGIPLERALCNPMP